MDDDLKHILTLMRAKGILRITHDYPLTEELGHGSTDIEIWYTAPELGKNGRRMEHHNSNQLGTETP